MTEETGDHAVRNQLLRDEASIMPTSTFATATQTITAATPKYTFTCVSSGNQQIVDVPSGRTTYTWDYENQNTLTVLPSGLARYNDLHGRPASLFQGGEKGTGPLIDTISWIE